MPVDQTAEAAMRIAAFLAIFAAAGLFVFVAIYMAGGPRR